MSTPIRIQVVLDGSQTQGQLGQILSGAFGSASGRSSEMDQIFQRTWQNFGEMGAKVISSLQKQMATMLESHVTNFTNAMNRIGTTSRGATLSQFGPTNADRGALLRQAAFRYSNQLDYAQFRSRLTPDFTGQGALSSEINAAYNAVQSQRNDEEINRLKQLEARQRQTLTRTLQSTLDDAMASAKQMGLPILGPSASDYARLRNNFNQRTPDSSSEAMARLSREINSVHDDTFDQYALEDARSEAIERQHRAMVLSKQNSLAQKLINEDAEKQAQVQADHQEKMRNLFNRINQGGGQIARDALEAPVKFFESVGNEMIRLSAIIYSFRRVGNLIGDVTVGPVESVINATALSRRFQGSIAGTVGGISNARAIDDALISGLPGSPYTLEEARQSAQISSRISSLSPAFGLSSPSGAAAQTQEIAEIISRLQVGSPDKTGAEIGKAVQNYLEGNTRSLRQLGIDPRDLQSISGLTQKELAGDQQAALDALRTRSRQLVPDSIMNVRMTDPQFLVERIHDLFTIAMQRVGDSGLYDEVGAKLRAGFQQIFDYIESPEFRARATQIGQNLGVVLDNIVDAGESFLQAVSGSKDKATTPDAIAYQIQKTTEIIGDATKALTPIASDAGKAIGILADHIQALGAVASGGSVGSGRPFSFPGLDGSMSNAAKSAGSGMFSLWADSIASGYYVDTKPGTVFGPTRQQSFLDYMQKSFGASGVDTDLSYGDNLYGNKFSGVSRAIDLLGNQLPDSTDKFTKVLEDGSNSLDTIFSKIRITGSKSETPGSFFDKIFEYQSGRIDSLEETRGPIASVISKYGAQSHEGLVAQDMLDKIDQDLSQLTTGLHSAIQNALGNLRTAGGQWNVAAINALKGEDPSVRSAEIDRILSGNTDIGRRVTMANLGISDSMQQWFPWMGNLPEGVAGQFGGIGAIPTQYRPAALQDQISAHLDLLTQQGKYGQAPAYSTLMFGAGVDAQKLSYLQNTGMPQLQSQLISAQGRYNSNPSQENGLAVERLTADIARLRGEMDQLSLSSNAAMQSFLQFGKQATDAIENGLGNALYGLISGTEKASQAFRQMAQEILKSFTQMGVHAAFNSVGLNGSGNTGGAIGAIIKMFQGFGGGGDSKGNSPNIGGGPSVWSVGPTDSAANGAIWIPSYASGGVARSPMILVGERSDGIPEAVVPMTAGGRIPMGIGPEGPHAILPSGQRIPGSFVGYASGGILGNVGGSSTSGGLHVHNYFVSSEAEAQAHASSNAMSESDIVNIVSRDLMRGGATYRAVQRGGGR